MITGICIAVAIGWVIGDYGPGPCRGDLTRAVFKRIHLMWNAGYKKLSKRYKELTELARAQEDKEIEVIIQELDKELAERNE
jgi:hypothetical protein